MLLSRGLAETGSGSTACQAASLSQCVPETLSVVALQIMQQEVSPSFPASLKSCLRAAGDLQSAAQLLLLTIHSALLEAGLHLVQVSRAATSLSCVPVLVQLRFPQGSLPCAAGGSTWCPSLHNPRTCPEAVLEVLTDLCINNRSTCHWHLRPD